MSTLRLPHANEDAEQKALFDWMHLARWQGRQLVEFAWHCPNGGARNTSEAAKLKRMGVKPGVPDVSVAIAAGLYHGLYIEMKAVGGRVTAEQTDVHKMLRDQGYRVDVCFGWVEAVKAIERYLGLAGTLQERG